MSFRTAPHTASDQISGYIDVEFEGAVGEDESCELRKALSDLGLQTSRAVDCTLTATGSVDVWQRVFGKKILNVTAIREEPSRGAGGKLRSVLQTITRAPTIPKALGDLGAKAVYIAQPSVPRVVTGKPYEVQFSSLYPESSPMEIEPVIDGADVVGSERWRVPVAVTEPPATIPLHAEVSSRVQPVQPQTA